MRATVTKPGRLYRVRDEGTYRASRTPSGKMADGGGFPTRQQAEVIADLVNEQREGL